MPRITIMFPEPGACYHTLVSDEFLSELKLHSSRLHLPVAVVLEGLLDSVTRFLLEENQKPVYEGECLSCEKIIRSTEALPPNSLVLCGSCLEEKMKSMSQGEFAQWTAGKILEKEKYANRTRPF